MPDIGRGLGATIKTIKVLLRSNTYEREKAGTDLDKQN